MKKLFLTGIGLLLAFTIAFAQRNPEEVARQEVSVLTEKLALTEDQQKPIFLIVLEGTKAKEALKADATLSPQVLAEALSKLQATTDAQVAEKLTDEQERLGEKFTSDGAVETRPAAPAVQEQVP